MKKIIGIGNALVDILVKLKNDEVLNKFDLPRGSMTLVDENKIAEILKEVEQDIVQKSAGGSAANTINGLAKLGVSTSFIAKTGNDEIGNFFKQDLLNNGVNESLYVSNTGAGRVAALISPDSERTFATYLGASIELSASDLNEDVFNGYDICYIEGYLVQNHELIETACKLAKKKGLQVCIDLASFNVVEENLEFLKRIIGEYIDIIFANEEEAKAFTGMEPAKALDFLADIVDVAIVKIGEKGSMVKSGDNIFKAGIIEAKAVDTTGAGDLFASGFLYGYVKGLDFKKCAEMGAVASGKVVEVIGAKMQEDRWTEINQLISEIE